MAEYLAENARLRQLSRRHSEGQLSAEEFRAARREILEALEAGLAQAEAPVDVVPAIRVPELETADATDIRAPDDSTVFFKTMPPQFLGNEAAVSPGVAAAGWDNHTRVLAAVLGISLLLAIGALVYVFAL
jgi:hypothetical protein